MGHVDADMVFMTKESKEVDEKHGVDFRRLSASRVMAHLGHFFPGWRFSYLSHNVYLMKKGDLCSNICFGCFCMHYEFELHVHKTHVMVLNTTWGGGVLASVFCFGALLGACCAASIVRKKLRFIQTDIDRVFGMVARGEDVGSMQGIEGEDYFGPSNHVEMEEVRTKDDAIMAIQSMEKQQTFMVKSKYDDMVLKISEQGFEYASREKTNFRLNVPWSQVWSIKRVSTLRVKLTILGDYEEEDRKKSYVIYAQTEEYAANVFFTLETFWLVHKDGNMTMDIW